MDDDNKLEAKISKDTSISKDASDYELPEELKHTMKSVGVAKMELMNKEFENTYFKVILFLSCFLVGFAYSLDIQIRSTFTAYATGSFSEHSLLSTINVVTTIVGAGGQLPFARLVDAFGRMEVYIFSVLLYVVGTVVESQSTNLTRYACGSILYQFGYVGVVLILVIILSDLSSLRWRLYFLLTPGYSYIIITWINGNVISAVNPIKHWSWGIGMWAFIFPLANIPFFLCMGYMWLKARRTEQWIALRGHRRKIIKEKGVLNFFIELSWELDVIGAFLMIVCLGCILVPLTLAGGLKAEWKKAHIIVPLVVGVALVPAFICWEKYVSKHPITPVVFFSNRGIWCPLVMSFLFMFIDMVMSEYLYTILLVAVNQSVSSATRITTLSSFVSVIVGFFYGMLTVQVRRLKPFMVFGTSMWMLALGLMFHYRGGTSSKPGIIAAECIMGFGTGFFSYPITVIMQSNVNHEFMAVVTSLGYTLYRVGSAVGSSVGGAIWSQKLYSELNKQLNNSTLAMQCYTDPYTFIETYTWDTPERQQVVFAYRHVQRILIIVGLVFCAPLILMAIMTKDRKLPKVVSVEQASETDVSDSPFDLVAYLKNKFEKKKHNQI